MLKIEESTIMEEQPCIVCGKFTEHAHYYSNDVLKKVAVCKECCRLGSGGKHGIIDLRSKVYWCKSCNVERKSDEVGQIADSVFLCPVCNNPVKRKS